MQCESIINTLPSELNINYLSIDNPKTRKVILQDSQLEIKIVPTILVVDIKGKVSKFEGKTCFEYLSQFQPPPPPAPKQSFLQEEVIVKPTHTPPPPQPTKPQQPKSQQKPPQQQQQKPKKTLVPINEPINFDEELFNSQPTNNITSLDDDDDEMSEEREKSTPIPPPLPLQRPPSPQQQQQQQQKNVKPNILAHAQAMQKSRLQDDDFNKKNH